MVNEKYFADWWITSDISNTTGCYTTTQFGYQNINDNREPCTKAMYLSHCHQRIVACSNPNATNLKNF
jgi:hypothetical protein